jgi:hypothetical protein
MPRKVFKQAAKHSGWRSGDERESGRERLGKEVGRYRGQLAYRVSLLFSGHSGGFSGRLISYGEMLSDFSVTMLGRVVTATLALTLAYVLIPH